MSALFDLHCDTLTCNGWPPYEDVTETLDTPAFQLALSKVPAGTRWVQCFAIFVPDEVRGEDAAAFFERHAASFRRQAERHRDRMVPCRSLADMEAAGKAGKCAGLLTVEGGAALAGRLERVQALCDAGVRMMTLTWNGENEIGSGNGTDHGLSHFGREAIRALEQAGIWVDASHLNDKGFDGLLETAEKPFVASHSNARTVCGHRRNLTDEQIGEMVSRRCLIGLNYYNAFLREDGLPATLDDLWRHVEHFLELGAEHCLALGSDADGADLPSGLDSPERFAGLYAYFLDRGLSPAAAEGILWKNAFAFFKTQNI